VFKLGFSVRRVLLGSVVLAGVSLLPARAEAAAGLPVVVAWNANAESSVAGYLVYIGTEPGVYSQLYDVGNLTSYTFYGGNGGQRYYFAVSAYATGLLEGPLSVEVSTVVAIDPSGGSAVYTGGGSSGGGATGGGESGGGGGGSAPPVTTSVVSAPVTAPTPSGPGVVLQPAIVSGTTVTLQWNAVGGLSVLDYVIEAGSAPGFSNIYNGSVGLINQISATVGDGLYYVRLRARTGATTSVVSNEIRFASGFAGIAACTAPPTTPTGLVGSVVGGTASLGWRPAGDATSYVVQAGTAPGLSDVYYGNVGAGPAVSAGVSPGFSAYVRVVAVNACGQSAASTELLLR
jgi:hypothetical protein